MEPWPRIIVYSIIKVRATNYITYKMTTFKMKAFIVVVSTACNTEPLAVRKTASYCKLVNNDGHSVVIVDIFSLKEEKRTAPEAFLYS